MGEVLKKKTEGSRLALTKCKFGGKWRL